MCTYICICMCIYNYNMANPFCFGVYTILRLTTQRWAINKGSPPWEKLIVILPAIASFL